MKPSRLFVFSIAIAGVIGFPTTGEGRNRIGDTLEYKRNCIREAWTNGSWDLHLSGYAWHLRGSYSEQQLVELNSRTYGGGLGRSIVDDDGDIHSIFAMGLSDSHNNLQLMAGYQWNRYWRVSESEIQVGLGYTMFLFSRKDIANYMPLPGLLPLVSVRFRDVEVLATFIPRINENIQGNTVYLYARLRL